MVLNRLAALTAAAVLIPLSAVAAYAGPTIHFEGVVDRIDISQPHAVVHLTDAATGKRYAMESSTPNTFPRVGIDVTNAKGMKLAIEAIPLDDGNCTPECRLHMRSMALPDGRKIFLGAPDKGALR